MLTVATAVRSPRLNDRQYLAQMDAKAILSRGGET